ncbi:MAG TPA: hypothetical protein VN752_05325 [Solirubrobacterales bacterium]|nr:hypothetical protein [Solirubrobacterales bacterium]
MEIQEFAPRHLIAQFGFQKKQASVVDRRGALAGELQELLGASSASLDPTAAEVTTRDGMNKFRIGMVQLVAVLNIDDFDDDMRKVEDFFQRGMDLLDAPPLAQVVAHTSDVAAVPSFDDLRDGLLEALSSTSSRLRDAVGIPLSDLGWSYDFDDDRWIVQVRIGPMRDDELRQLFEAPDATDFPAASLFVDVKAKLRVGDSKKDSLDLWASALERNRQITANLTAWLTEALA